MNNAVEEVQIKNIGTISTYWPFWAAIAIPLVIALAVSVFIYLNIKSFLFFCMDSVECFSNFYELYKIPLALLSATPLLAGVVGLIHRSKESDQQIKISTAQYETGLHKTNFDIYVKHKEEFIKKFESYSGYYFRPFSAEKLYLKVFSTNHFDHVSFTQIDEEMKKNCLGFLEHLSSFYDKDHDPNQSRDFTAYLNQLVKYINYFIVFFELVSDDRFQKLSFKYNNKSYEITFHQFLSLNGRESSTVDFPNLSMVVDNLIRFILNIIDAVFAFAKIPILNASSYWSNAEHIRISMDSGEVYHDKKVTGYFYSN